MTRHRDTATLYAGRDDFRDEAALAQRLSRARPKTTSLNFAERRGVETPKPFLENARAWLQGGRERLREVWERAERAVAAVRERFGQEARPERSGALKEEFSTRSSADAAAENARRRTLQQTFGSERTPQRQPGGGAGPVSTAADERAARLRAEFGQGASCEEGRRLGRPTGGAARRVREGETGSTEDPRADPPGAAGAEQARAAARRRQSPGQGPRQGRRARHRPIRRAAGGHLKSVDRSGPNDRGANSLFQRPPYRNPGKPDGRAMERYAAARLRARFVEAGRGADLLILAGDIGRVRSRRNVSPFSYARQAADFLGCRVILVPGNHEYYRGCFREDRAAMLAASDPAVTVLDKGEATIARAGAPLRILGATLWTDYAVTGNPAAPMAVAEREIYDHRLIRRSEGQALFTPVEPLPNTGSRGRGSSGNSPSRRTGRRWSSRITCRTLPLVIPVTGSTSWHPPSAPIATI